MKRSRSRLIDVGVLFFLLVFQGCVTMVKHHDIPVETGSGTTLSAEEVGNAIIKAGKSKGWIMNEGNSGEILGKFKSIEYFIKVAIPHTAKSYSIVYRDSEGLRHRGDKIHKKYNKIIDELQFAILNGLAVAHAQAESKPSQEVPVQAPSPTIEVQMPSKQEAAPPAEVQAPPKQEGPSMDEFADWLRQVEQEGESTPGTSSAYSK